MKAGNQAIDKIIYVDVGTHFGQEYQSIFGSEKITFIKLIRRIFGFYILRRGEMFPLGMTKEFLRKRRELRSSRGRFLVFFVEANANVIQCGDVYKNADGVFNCALCGEQNLSIKKLYLANNKLLGQGSSIFLKKHNVSVNSLVPSLGVPATSFFDSLKYYIESNNEKYSVILRLNCEGAEDDVIYAAHQVFSANLVLLMGSLKDVRDCKGNAAYDALESYLRYNNLPFVSFSHSVASWPRAHSAIYAIYK